MSKNNKFKVAVCLFGHLRTYKKCAPFLHKNLLSLYDCSLFMHTWTALDHNTQTWHKFAHKKGFTDEADIVRVYGDFRSLAVEEQQPKNLGSIKVEALANKMVEQDIFGIDSVFYSMRFSNRLREQYEKENKVEYKYIVCIRPDIILKQPIAIEQIIKTLPNREHSKAFFMFGKQLSKCIRGFESISANDVMFFAESAAMSDVLNNTAQITERFKKYAVLPYCPEHELIKIAQERGWTPYILDYQFKRDWDILRPILLPSRKQIIQMHIRKNFVRIYIFQIVLRRFLRIRFALFNWEFDLCIGASGNSIDEI